MNAPAEVAGRFAAVCLLGLGLGAVYGFLRPPRQRHAHLGVHYWAVSGDLCMGADRRKAAAAGN